VKDTAVIGPAKFNVEKHSEIRWIYPEEAAGFAASAPCVDDFVSSVKVAVEALRDGWARATPAPASRVAESERPALKTPPTPLREGNPRPQSATKSKKHK
jgi:hypothetical protein